MVTALGILAATRRETPLFRRKQYPGIRGDASPSSVVFVKDLGTYLKVAPERRACSGGLFCW